MAELATNSDSAILFGSTSFIKESLNVLANKRAVKEVIENSDFILTFPKIGERKNVVKHEYYLTIDTSKEICMIENNETGRNIRRYFIEVEKRYRNIINAGNNTNQLINIMILSLLQ